MNRKILFRGKTKDGTWIKGDLVQGRDGETYITEGIGANAKEVIPETVGQYIGLKDKNGVKAFDGDVVNVQPFTVNGRIEEVKYFTQGGFVSIHPFQSDGYHWPSVQSEIIGNIHDNPKLLNNACAT